MHWTLPINPPTPTHSGFPANPSPFLCLTTVLFSLAHCCYLFVKTFHCILYLMASIACLSQMFFCREFKSNNFTVCSAILLVHGVRFWTTLPDRTLKQDFSHETDIKIIFKRSKFKFKCLLLNYFVSQQLFVSTFLWNFFLFEFLMNDYLRRVCIRNSFIHRYLLE